MLFCLPRYYTALAARITGLTAKQLSASYERRSPHRTPPRQILPQVRVWDTRGMVSRTHRSLRIASAELELHACTNVPCAHTAGQLSSHAPACGSLSGTPFVIPTQQRLVSPDRIAPQSVAKTFFQLQAKLEPMSLEERGRTGLTSKATGNPFAFTERPANGTSPLNSFSFGPLLFTGPMERWRLWRLWTDLPEVTTCAHSLIKGSSHQSPLWLAACT